MATPDLKNLEKLVNEVLESIKGLGAKNAPKNYDKTLKNISTKLDNIEEKLPLTVEGDGNSSEIVDRVEQVTEALKQQTEDFIKEIQFAFENYQNNNGILNPQDIQASDNIKDFVSIITNEIMDLKNQFERFNTDFTEININTNMTISKEILSMKNNVLALNDTIDSIKNKIESFNFKDELSPVVSEDVTNSVTEALTSYLNNFKTEVFNLLAKVSDGITSIIDNQKILEGIELSIGEIRDGQYKNKDDIIKIISSNIAEENKKLLPQILQMVNSISFDDAAEEIKDGLYAVNENLGIVNKNIETGAQASSQILEQVNTISKDINDISSNMPNPKVFDTISKIDETVEDISKAEIINKVLKIDSVLDEISAEFNMLTKGSKVGAGDYLYTLLDLESDISKVRIILDELNTSVKDDKSLSESVAAFVEKTAKLYSDPDYKAILDQFDTLNDDITSISKRTNKLILTSDDAAEKLEKNIQDFQNIMLSINNTVQRFENSNVLKALLERTGNIHKVVKNSFQSCSAINEAFVYLASWIDNTSAEIKDIKNEISEIKKLVVESNKNMPDDISPKAIQEFSKIEKLIKDNCKKEDNSDIKEMITSLTSQVQTLNETISANRAVNKKIDKMEKQIQQLLTFVEEE